VRSTMHRIVPWLTFAACSNACLLVEPLDEVNDDAGNAGEESGGSGATPSSGGTKATGGASGVGGGGRGGSGAMGGSSAATGGSGTGGTPSGGSSGKGGQAGSSNGGTGGANGGTGGSDMGGSSGTGNAPNGYVVTGNWHGYSWANGNGETFDDSVGPAPSGQPICISGTIAADPPGNGFAMLGLNLNQEIGSSDVGAITPVDFGITVEVDNPGGSILRLELIGADGTVWCVPFNGDGGFYAYNSFTQDCWSANGAAYEREPLRSIGLAVPSSSSSTVPFDYCLVSVEEALTGPEVPDLTSCTPDCDPGVIDDFEGSTGVIYEQSGRAGAWYAYNDMSGAEQWLVLHGSPGHASEHALHTWGDAFTDWGAGVGANLNQPSGTLLKQAYDASMYTGLRFTYRSESRMRLTVHTLGTTPTTDPYTEGGTCNETQPSNCIGFTVNTGEGDGWVYPAASDWTTIEVPFSVLAQPSWSTVPDRVFEPSTMVSIAFEALKATPFDFWIDDLTFY
jgi:hypothetical protein